MFKIDPVEIEVIGEKLKVLPLSASKVLAFRAEYLALGDDDLAGIVKLMNRLITDSVVEPKIKDADLEHLDIKSLTEIFKAVSEANGISEKKTDPTPTT